MVFRILAKEQLMNYLADYKMQNRPFQYILLQMIPCKIDQSYFHEQKMPNRIEEYRGSIIKDIQIVPSTLLSYQFIEEENEELRLFFPSLTVGLSVVDHYHFKEKVLLFEKEKDIEIERSFNYQFEDVSVTVPLKSETWELFDEKITFAIYDQMEDMARDIVNGEVVATDGFGFQLSEAQVDKLFDENLIVYEP